MNERELSIIRALGEEFSLALKELGDNFEKRLSQYQEKTEKQLEKIFIDLGAIKDAPQPDFVGMIADAVASLPVPESPVMPDIDAMINEAVSALPAPQDGKSVTAEELMPIVEELVGKAVAAIPEPRHGKDYDPDVLKLAVQHAVSEAVSEIPAPQDGKSVTVEELRPVIQEIVSESMPELPDVKSLVSEAMAEQPEAQPGRDGNDGRDALALEVSPCIDEAKSYPRGSYATHNGGLWRAYEKTHGMRGWECIVDGLCAVDVAMDKERHFTVTLTKASGNQLVREFDVPVMLYRGTYKSGEVYTPGDTVTWGGSLWHCDKQTVDKPGENGSAGWTLAAKRGRDARGRE